MAGSNVGKLPEGMFYRYWATIFAIFILLVSIVRTPLTRATRKFQKALSEGNNNNNNNNSYTRNHELDNNLCPKEEDFRPPSPALGPTKADIISSALKKLSELEEKVDILQSKPFQMPFEKEELLNAAVYRVDALEAELIATKKALHEALMRQDELLEYIDRQAHAKLRKKKWCF